MLNGIICHCATTRRFTKVCRPGIAFGLVTLFMQATLLFAASVCAAQGAEWSSRLKGGGEITVNPRTNRATIMKDGVKTQPWDGVHQLQDGSTITIRSGIAVPTTEILEARRPKPKAPAASTWIGAPIVGYSPCERLVRRVCGTDDECAAAPGCEPARQLLTMEQEERSTNTTPNIMTHSSGQCQEADKDRSFFVTCGQDPVESSLPPGTPGTEMLTPADTVTPCQHLVYKVCGMDDACADQEACDAARQMLELEASDQQNIGTRGYGTNPTSAQCRQLLPGDSFFRACANTR
jgi:hypothetical protein